MTSLHTEDKLLHQEKFVISGFQPANCRPPGPEPNYERLRKTTRQGSQMSASLNLLSRSAPPLKDMQALADQKSLKITEPGY